MNLLNEECLNCVYGNGKPLTCNKCGEMLMGGFCFPCNLEAKNSFICDQNAYSFDDIAYNSNYLPQPQYENYLCNLCGNNSHDGYDCQQQFPFVYEQEPSYNQNYDEISDEVFQANHSDQNEESFKNPSNEIDVSNSDKEKEGPSQDSDIRQLIREECSVKVCEEQSALNTKLLSINSNCQRLEKEQQEVKSVIEQPAERGNRIKSLQNFRNLSILSTGYEHLSITPEMESDEVTESNAENLLPTPSECEVTLEDKRECDMPVCENFPVCDDHSDIFSDSKIDDDISVYDDDFEDIEYVEASLFDPEIVSVEEENVVQQEEEESDNSLSEMFLPEFKTFCYHSEETRSGNTTHADNSLPEYDSFCFEIEPDQERLTNLVKNNISNDSSNDPLLEEADLFLASDNSIPPGIENVADDSEGDVRFLEELLIDDSILSHESSDSNFEDNPSVPLSPPKPPDTETDTGEEIPVVMNDKDKFDKDCFFFRIDKVFSLLYAESEDTIFDPGISM
nr:hypothetical protein [Tanacetum cinerariifolium]